MDNADLKADILSSLRADIAAAIRSELKDALADNFDFIKSELKEVKAEITNSTAAIRSEIDHMKVTVSDMEAGLSTWTDEVVVLQETVAELKTEVTKLKAKNEDMEGRMRRCNIRIIGVAEEPGSSNTASISKLLKDVLHLDKDILVDRSHRGLAPRKSDGKPRVIIAKLHYYQECVDVLHRAREQGPLRYKGEPIAIFPDYTVGVAKARAAFNDIRNILRGRRDIRYGILFPAGLFGSGKAMTYVKSIIPTAKAAKER